MIKNLSHAQLLRISFLAGIILLVLIGGVLTVIYGSGSFSRAARRLERENEFSRLLREYDFRCARILETESPIVRRQEFERLETELDRVEKQAGWVESWLSVLKRRRALAAYSGEIENNSHYVQSYRQSAWQAATAFPYSEPIAAVAAAAFIHDAAITREGAAELRKIIPLLADTRLFPMRLGLHVLLGDFGSPEKAAAGLLADSLHTPDFIVSELRQQISLAEQEAVSIIADLLILRIIAGDVPRAAVDIQTALFTFPSPELTRLAAEYFYDFGDLLRSAELFSMLPDEADLFRQADALWLAGYADNARILWTMLTAEPPEAATAAYNSLQSKALYNLALTAQTMEETAAVLQRQIRQGSAWQAAYEPSRQYGLIRLSRLFDAPQALAILESERGSAINDGGASPVDTLIDLEILKRRSEIGELARVIAEVWLLLDRYPSAEEIYQWGLWYFNLQRNYAESAVLLKAAARYNFAGWWTDLYEAIRLIREGNTGDAEKILAAIPTQWESYAHWAADANLGRILETRHAPARALESYERAMAIVPEYGKTFAWQYAEQSKAWHNTASRIQVRIALCLRSMGRTSESRRALEYALDLNRDNINARLELSRLE